MKWRRVGVLESDGNGNKDESEYFIWQVDQEISPPGQLVLSLSEY